MATARMTNSKALGYMAIGNTTMFSHTGNHATTSSTELKRMDKTYTAPVALVLLPY
jgi:hypothetical protein